MSLPIACALNSAMAMEVCGFYQSEDFGNRVIYSLTDFGNASNPSNPSDAGNTDGVENASSSGNPPTYYSIQNPASAIGQAMIRAQCYCVTGDVRDDLEFIGDESYKVILLTGIISGPDTGCLP